MADGEPVEAVTLISPGGVQATVITFGATLQSLIAPDRHGAPAEITLGYDHAADYMARPQYLGVTIGRYANRIAGGAFLLDGQEYRVPPNDRGHALHGGSTGFDRRNWRIVDIATGAVPGVTLALVSPHGDQGFPGELAVTVTYSLSPDGSLSIDFTAETDRPTIVCLTNHAVFNLAGAGAAGGIADQLLEIPAQSYLPVDAGQIPTGERRAVAGTPFDFRTPRRLAPAIDPAVDPQLAIGGGFDHTLVLDKGVTDTPQIAARLADPASGRLLDVLTTEPSIQVYGGNSLGGIVGRGLRAYRAGDGIALEPQKFPDTPNRPGFPSARIASGKPYRHTMIYRLSTFA